MSSKKIWQYPEATSITNDDYILMDSNTETGSQCLKANKIGAVHITKTVTERKVYKASDDNANGFSEVTVAVPYTDVHYDKDDIVSFVGENLPLKSVTAYIEPQQDLHGYDAPWAGGAGKNKFDVDYYGSTTTYFNRVDTTFINKEVDSRNDFRLLVQTFNNDTFISESNQEVITSAGRYSVIINIPSTPTFIRIKHNGSSSDLTLDYPFTQTGQYTISLTVVKTNPSTVGGLEFKDIQIESGSTATSYAPYSNICPISGWDEVNVVDDAVYGGNINWNQLAKELNSTNWVAVSSTATYSDGEATLTSSNNSPVAKFLAPFSQTTLNHVYYVYGKGKSDGTSEVSIGVWQDNGGDYSGSTGTGWVTSTSYTNIYKIAKTTANTSIIGARLRNAVPSGNYGVFKDINIIDLTQLFGETKADEIYAMEQAEAGSGVAYFKSLFYKDYYPYNSGEITNVSAVNGDTDKYRIYTIDLDGTRYGGSVDVTGGESTIVGKKFLLAPTDSQIFNVTNRNCVFSAPETANGFTLAVTNLLCNKLKPSNYSTAEDNHIHFANATLLTIYTSEDVGTTKEDWIQWFDDMQVEIYYKLATPTTFYTQPTAVKSLLGINNVWADTGEIAVEWQTLYVTPTT